MPYRSFIAKKIIRVFENNSIPIKKTAIHVRCIVLHPGVHYDTAPRYAPPYTASRSALPCVSSWCALRYSAVMIVRYPIAIYCVTLCAILYSIILHPGVHYDTATRCALPCSASRCTLPCTASRCALRYSAGMCATLYCIPVCTIRYSAAMCATL